MPSCTGSVTLFSCISLLGKYFYSTQLQKSVGKKFFRYKTVGLFIFPFIPFRLRPHRNCLFVPISQNTPKIRTLFNRPHSHSPGTLTNAHTQRGERRKEDLFISHTVSNIRTIKKFVVLLRMNLFLSRALCVRMHVYQHFRTRGWDHTLACGRYTLSLARIYVYIDWRYVRYPWTCTWIFGMIIYTKWRQPATDDDYYNGHKLGDNEIMKIVQPQQIHLQCINVWWHCHTHARTRPHTHTTRTPWKRGSCALTQINSHTHTRARAKAIERKIDSDVPMNIYDKTLMKANFI